MSEVFSLDENKDIQHYDYAQNSTTSQHDTIPVDPADNTCKNLKDFISRRSRRDGYSMNN